MVKILPGVALQSFVQSADARKMAEYQDKIKQRELDLKK